MACCGSPEVVTSEKTISKEIESRMEQKYQADKSTVKVLILGAGESGKSTILKQMRILHDNGFSNEQKAQYGNLIRENTLECIQSLCKAVTDLGIGFSSPESKQMSQRILGLPCDAKSIPLDVQAEIKTLWNDERIQHAYQRANEFHLLDSAAYFFLNLSRIFLPDFIPNDQDILRSRKATIGIVETDFVIDTLPFKIFDVGGQRGERRKWIHCFEGISAIMYVASLSEYDQVLVEDSTRNRMAESLNVFEAIINLPWFRKTPIILFLNKHDLYLEKIKKIDIGIYFPAYLGGLQEEAGVTWIREQYFFKNADPRKTIYCHVTDATDTNCIAFVWKATKHIILEQHLNASGLMLY